MTKRENISSGLTWTYGYDHANQLVSAKLWDEDPDLVTEETLLREVEYKYDVFGNRVQKTIDWDGEDVDPAEVMKFAIDGWNPAKATPIGNENNDIWGELSAEDLLTTKYLRSDVVDALFARVEVGGDAFWFLNDHLGSIRDIISNDALIQDDVNYDAFGNITEDSAYRGRYGWTGREWDVETELQYNRARYYDPKIGRWISQDPLGFDAGDSNLYRYVTNRSTILLDASGLAPGWRELLAGARARGLPTRMIEEIEKLGPPRFYVGPSVEFQKDQYGRSYIQLTETYYSSIEKGAAGTLLIGAVYNEVFHRWYDDIVINGRRNTGLDKGLWVRGAVKKAAKEVYLPLIAKNPDHPTATEWKNAEALVEESMSEMIDHLANYIQTKKDPPPGFTNSFGPPLHNDGGQAFAEEPLKSAAKVPPPLYIRNLAFWIMYNGSTEPFDFDRQLKNHWSTEWDNIRRSRPIE